MARPAGFSDSEDDELDDYIHSGDDYRSHKHPDYETSEKKNDDLFEDIEVPSFMGLNQDVEAFKTNLYEGNLESVKEYIEAHRPRIRSPLVTSSRSWSDLSPLEIAAISGHASMVSYLLEESCEKELPSDGPCPLLAVASASVFEKNKMDLLSVAETLLSASEDVNRREATSGMTPLMMASKNAFVELVKLFVIQGGAEVDAMDYNKWTALCYAANVGSGDVLRYLLVEGNASPLVTTVEGFDPSDLAERRGHRHILEVLDAYSESRSAFRGALRESDSSQKILMVLRGFGLTSDEIEAFSREGVKDLATLITLSEKDITDKVGIFRVGVVRSLCEFIKDMHRKEWKRSCLPKVQIYDPSKGLKFSCPESISVMGNIRKQILYLRSTIIYLQRGISENPEVLQLGKDQGDVSDLYKYCLASLTESEGLIRDLRSMKRTLQPNLTKFNAMPVDGIKLCDNNWWTWSRAPLLLVPLASIPLWIYIVRKYNIV